MRLSIVGNTTPAIRWAVRTVASKASSQGQEPCCARREVINGEQGRAAPVVVVDDVSLEVYAAVAVPSARFACGAGGVGDGARRRPTRTPVRARRRGGDAA